MDSRSVPEQKKNALPSDAHSSEEKEEKKSTLESAPLSLSVDDLPREINFNIRTFCTSAELLKILSVSREWSEYSREIILLRVKNNPQYKRKLNEVLNITLEQPNSCELKEVAIMKKVRHLISLGADANDYGAMIQAVSNGHTESLKLLYDYGANVRRNGAEAAHLAARYNHSNILEFLHEKGHNLEEKRTYYGFTPAHEAAECNSIDAIRTLGEFKINFNIKNNKGHTPIQTVLDISSNDSNESLEKRFLTFSALLEAGACNKGSKDDLLSWFNSKISWLVSVPDPFSPAIAFLTPEDFAHYSRVDDYIKFKDKVTERLEKYILEQERFTAFFLKKSSVKEMDQNSIELTNIVGRKY